MAEGLIQKRFPLDKARKFLEDARLLQAQVRYDSCASRGYYAIYRAAVALLTHFGYIRPAWNHGRLRVAVYRQLVEEQARLDFQFVQDLDAAYSLRIVADYERRSLSPEEGNRCVAMAESFVRRTEEVIEA